MSGRHAAFLYHVSIMMMGTVEISPQSESWVEVDRKPAGIVLSLHDLRMLNNNNDSVRSDLQFGILLKACCHRRWASGSVSNGTAGLSGRAFRPRRAEAGDAYRNRLQRTS